MNGEILNTQVVLMRKYVKQARVHMVRKLIRKAETLHKKNGTNEMKKKFERKANNVVEEILILKELKDDDISKFALLGSQLEANAPTSDPQQRVLTKITTCKVLANQVMKFRDEWPNWHETLPKMLKPLVSKNEFCLLKKSAVSKEKSVSAKSQGSVIKKKRNGKNGIGSKILEQKVKFKTKKKLKNNAAKCSVENMERDSDEHKCVSSAVSDYSFSFDSKTKGQTEKGVNLSVTQCSQSRTKKNPVHRLHKNIPSVLGKVKVCSEVLDVSDLVVGKVQASVECKSSGMPTKKRKLKKQVTLDCSIINAAVTDTAKKVKFQGHQNSLSVANDPFFMGTEDDVPFENTVKSQHLNNTPASNDGLNRHQRRLALRTSNANNKGPKASRNDVKNKETKRAIKHCDVKTDRLHVTAANVSLHPSWEAKKRLQEQQKLTVPFQGKKIKFSDD